MAHEGLSPCGWWQCYGAPRMLLWSGMRAQETPSDPGDSWIGTWWPQRSSQSAPCTCWGPHWNAFLVVSVGQDGGSSSTLYRDILCPPAAAHHSALLIKGEEITWSVSIKTTLVLIAYICHTLLKPMTQWWLPENAGVVDRAGPFGLHTCDHQLVVTSHLQKHWG